ncbi:hypothetical protein ACEN2S_09275 [Phaeovulum sp. W22_SRMD_FR3]
MRVPFLGLVFGLGILAAGQSFAQDEALYDAPPPPDAVFVRFLGMETAAPVTWHGVDVPLEILKTQDYLVFHGPQVAMDPGQFATVIGAAGGASVDLIEGERKAEKVRISVVNLSGRSVDLKAVGKKVVPIVADVAAGGMGERLVNPISVVLQTFDKGKPLGEEYKIDLRRGEDPTILVDGDGAVSLIYSVVHKGIVE